MEASGADGGLRDRAARYSPAQRRTLDVALELFADHGVGGTSLSMIADALGVTKAAVYHQFRSKESIVRGVLEVHLEPLEEAVAAAEARGASARARDELLADVIDVVLGSRRVWSTLQGDPVLLRVLDTHEPARRLFARLFAVLVGDDPGAAARVRAAVLSAAIGSVAHPFVAEVDDDTLRRELLAVTRRLIDPR